MKKQNKIISILMSLMILFTCTFDLIYALNENVLPGYNQVAKIGGTNSLNRAGEEDGVIVSKTISESNINNQKNHENYFDITLTVRTKSKIEEIITAQDIAVVIVMDISATMKSNTMDGSTTTRLDEAKAAAIKFVNKFQEESANSPLTKREIGFVTFATNSQKVFELSECNDVNEKTTMENAIKAITEKTGTARYTNMEAGLARAKKMLEASPIKNKYIIFLTDGLPTTYSTTEGGNTGYNPLADPPVTNPTAPQPGLFYNFNTNQPISTASWGGTNYSDFAARRAEAQTQAILNSNITMYSIGVGIAKQHTLNHLRYNGYSYTFDTDKEENNFQYYNQKRYYAVTPGITKPLENADEATRKLYDDSSIYKVWLRDYMSSGNGYYYDSEKEGDILNAYDKIFAGIKQITEESSQATWVAEDPMGSDNNVTNVEFLGFYDDNGAMQTKLDKKNNVANQSDTASISEDNKTILWDLKYSQYTETKEGNTTFYDYSIRYRIRLENEKSDFNINNLYETNGTTTLTYVIRNKDGFLSDDKYIDFPIPKVVGYLGQLIFTKKSSFDNTNLSEVKFKLTHDENCQCLQEAKHSSIPNVAINDMYATSNEEGTVTFSNIPSGHTYKLIEVETPNDYILSETIYDITVSYGETTGTPQTNIIINDIKKGNLEIKKVVEGNTQNPGIFKFNLEVWFKDNPLTGTYTYKINNGEEKSINIGTDIIELNNNDSMIIYNLPVGTTYRITEITTDGYTVQHKINESNRIDGFVATCNQENSCRIEEGDTNKIEFINITGYLLPATGSSGMLILLIIGLLLLIVPVIYIGYMFYKEKRSMA